MRALTAHLSDIRRAWRWAVVLGGAMASLAAVAIVAIALAGDQALRGTDPTPAIWLAAVVAAATLLSIIISHTRQRLLERAALWVDHAILQDLVTERLAGGSSASLATAASKQAGNLREGLACGAAAASDAIWLPVVVVVLAMVDWRMAVIAGVAIAIGFGLAVIGASGHVGSSGECARAEASVLADGASHHASLVRSLSIGPGIGAAWTQMQSVAVAAVYAKWTSAGRWRLAGNAFAFGAWFGVAGLVLAAMSDGAISRLDAALCLGVFGWIAWGLKGVIAASPQLRGARHAWSCLVATACVSPRATASAEIGAIRLDAASYVYPGRRYVAIGPAHMTLQPGEVAMVVGPPGAGKSTLAALVAGALVPTTGNAGSDGLRIGYVPELPILVDGTVGQNIARFSAADAQSLLAAADRAGVRDIIDGLDAGVETNVRPDVMQAMGGLTLREARAVTLARAVYAPIDILVLDKPELGMDVRDVHQIVTALQRIRDVGVGILIASNDPRFQVLADRFVHVEAGQVIGASVNAARRPGSAPIRLMRDPQHATAR